MCIFSTLKKKKSNNINFEIFFLLTSTKKCEKYISNDVEVGGWVDTEKKEENYKHI